MTASAASVTGSGTLISAAALLVMLVAAGLLIRALITRQSLLVLALYSVVVLCMLAFWWPRTARPWPTGSPTTRSPRSPSRARTARTIRAGGGGDASAGDVDLAGPTSSHHSGHGHHSGHHDHGGHNWGDRSPGDGGSDGSDSGGATSD